MIMRIKTFILIFIIISADTGFLSAQTTKGTFLLAEMTSIDVVGYYAQSSLNLGWTTYKSKNDSGDESDPIKAFSINLIPRVGYFVVDNLVLGLDFDINYARSKRQDSDFIYKSTLFTTGPFIRYYIPTQRLLPFAEINYSIGSNVYKWTDEIGEGGNKNQVQQFGFGIGMGFPLGEKVSFDTLIGYQSHIVKAKENNEDNARDIIGSIGLRLGLTIFL